MSDNFSTVDTKHIIEIIGDLSNRTEEIFLKLATSLPALFREIEKGITRASHLVQVFSKENVSVDENDRDKSILNSISRAEILVEEVSDFFLIMLRRDAELFDEISESIGSLSSLENQFTNIKEDSVDMEVVSLNAKIAALKSGRHSAGFAYISDELQKISSSTTGSADILTNLGENILRNLTSFIRKTEGIQDVQQSFNKRFREELKSVFRSYTNEVEGLLGYLASAIDEAESVKAPLENIMEIIQLQDIIRQSLQHVELVLKESGVETVSENSDQILDQIIFVKILYELSNDMLGDIGEKLSRSINIFNINLTELRSVLGKVNKNSSDVNGFSESNSEEYKPVDGLTHIVSESVETLESLINDLGKSLQEKNSISVKANEILDSLRSLEIGFVDSLKIVSQFYPINVNARIEVAKWNSLSQIGMAIGEMSDVTDKINDDMIIAMKLIKKIKNEVKVSVENYSAVCTDEITAINEITNRIKDCYRELTKSSSILTETLQSFSVYSNSFFRLLDDLEIDVANMSKLIDVINDIRDTLSYSVRDLDARKDRILSEIGMEEWFLKDSNLMEIVDRFSIFSYKQAAKTIAGIEIENEGKAGELGELTLF